MVPACAFAQQRPHAAAAPLPGNVCVLQFSRSTGGFTLHVIDTPSLLDQDNVSDAVSLS